MPSNPIRITAWTCAFALTLAPATALAAAPAVGSVAAPAVGSVVTPRPPARPLHAARSVLVGPAVLRSVDAGGQPGVPGWTADDGWVSGDVEHDPAAPAGNGVPAAVLQTNRHGGYFTYTLRHLVPGTRYTVRLQLFDPTSTAAGQRVFDVRSGGTTLLHDVDVFAATGARAVPTTRDVEVTADADGRVRLDFAGTTGDAQVAGLQVIGAPPRQRLRNYLAPADVTATPTGPTTTVLRWTTTPGIAQYAVRRDGVVVGRTADGAFVDSTARPGARHDYQVAAVDTDGTLGTLSATKRVTMPAAAPRRTGAFHTEGTRIIDPAGNVFVPVGANLAAPGSMDWAGSAVGHAADAKAWGWNTVRLALNPRNLDDAVLRSLVAEYRAAGLVVLLDAHQYWYQGDASADQQRAEVVALWKRLAPQYKDDSGVWFGVANEPGYLNDDWVELQAELISTVRAAGASNIVAVDAPAWGQDLGSFGDWFVGSRYAYSPTMTPTLIARFGNVILGQHNYGARYTDAASYGEYVDAVHAQGVPLISSEFGYTVDGTSSAGTFWQNQSAAKAVFAVNPAKGVGTLVWNGNVGDRYSLKQDNSPFWKGAPLDGISELGRDLWAISH